MPPPHVPKRHCCLPCTCPTGQVCPPFGPHPAAAEAGVHHLGSQQAAALDPISATVKSTLEEADVITSHPQGKVHVSFQTRHQGCPVNHHRGKVFSPYTKKKMLLEQHLLEDTCGRPPVPSLFCKIPKLSINSGFI